ncbi:MAG: hypothetical protein HY291_04945 [Planctomycetes bacterium]|nr:hypothetical protein [Planctomycetota bacterium]
MPELPEVESVVRALAPSLTGRSIKYVEVLNRSTVAGSPQKPDCLAGRRIERVLRRGKYIVFHFDGHYAMAVHLRMTGWLGVKSRERVAAENDKFVRMVFGLDGEAVPLPPRGGGSGRGGRTAQGHPPPQPSPSRGEGDANSTGRGTQGKFSMPGAASQELLLFRDIRKFGRVWCGRREEIIGLKSINKLGPEPLVITADAFAKRLRAKRGRLKSLLLNQEFLAGLGNIYADEALFAARLHPLAHAHRVPPASAARLHAAIQRILGKAISAGGSSIDDYLHPDGTRGWFQRELKAYGREGEPCTRCKAPIKRLVVGQRGTWFCPKCQKKR